MFTSLNGVTDLSVNKREIGWLGVEDLGRLVGSFLSFDLHVDIGVTVL